MQQTTVLNVGTFANVAALTSAYPPSSTPVAANAWLSDNSGLMLNTGVQWMPAYTDWDGRLFGIVADGTTDNGTALQNFITALESYALPLTSNHNRRGVLPPGIIKYTTAPSFSGGGGAVELVGSGGAGQTILAPSGCRAFTMSPNSEFVNVRYLQIDATNATDSLAIVYINTSIDSTLDYVQITNVPTSMNAAILIANSNNIQLRFPDAQCDLLNGTGSGILVVNSSVAVFGADVEGFNGSGGAGIRTQGLSHVSLYDTWLEANTRNISHETCFDGVVQASISSTTLTIVGTPTPGRVGIGSQLSGGNITGTVTVTALGTGTGGAGTYTIAAGGSQTAAQAQCSLYGSGNLSIDGTTQFQGGTGATEYLYILGDNVAVNGNPFYATGGATYGVTIASPGCRNLFFNKTFRIANGSTYFFNPTSDLTGVRTPGNTFDAPNFINSSATNYKASQASGSAVNLFKIQNPFGAFKLTTVTSTSGGSAGGPTHVYEQHTWISNGQNSSSVTYSKLAQYTTDGRTVTTAVTLTGTTSPNTVTVAITPTSDNASAQDIWCRLEWAAYPGDTYSVVMQVLKQ